MPAVLRQWRKWLATLAASVLCTCLHAQPNLTGLLNSLAATPERSWVRVNLNNYQDVWAPADLRPLNLASNPTPEKIIIAWSSFAWDSKRGKLILYGGGHANYSGNDVYIWDGPTQLWQRGALPSEILLTPNGFHTAIDGVDNAPVSAHTYDNNLYLPVIDRFITFGGASYNTGNPYVRPLSPTTSAFTGPYLFDIAKADGNRVGGSTGSHVQRVAPHPEVVGGYMWTNRDQHRGTVIGTPPSSHVSGMTAYATENGKDVIYVGARPGQGTDLNLYRYTINSLNDITQDTWQQVGLYWGGPTLQGSAGYDPIAKLFVRTGTQAQPITYWDLNFAAPNNKDITTTPTDLSGGFDFNQLVLSGMDFDPIRGVFVIWYGGPDVWELEAPIPTAPTGWTLRRVSAPTGAVPTTNVETGVLGKWKYIPNLDAYMGLQDAQNGNVWLFKPAGWQPPSGGPTNVPPTVNITSPASGASFAQGTAVAVDATASDSDGSVAKVDFYRDGALVGTDTTMPYSVSVSGLTLGGHTLQAVATDNVGGTATASVSITVVASGSGGTITLQDGLNGYAGTRDTYLSSWNVNENNADATTLLNSGAYTDLVRFAVFASEGGPVPSGATITSAQLSLYKTSYYDYVFQARRMLKDWVEGEATWSWPRIGATWAVAGAGGSGADYASVVDATASVGFSPGWLVFDVTAGVQAMSSGQANYGWRLLGVSGNSNEKQFASSEYATQSLRPSLVITYTTGSNAPPTVSITSPANGAVFVAGSTVTVNATAQDPGGSVSKVDFYRDGVLAGTDTTAPYSLPLTGLTSGAHSLTAVATDNVGATATSAAVTITINAAPSVSITSPASGASFAQGTAVAVDATASDSDGSVAKVDFYRDGALVGTDTTMPYSVSVSGLTLGGHTLQAVATDNVGGTATASVSITVVASGSGGTITLQDGLNGYAGTRDTYLSSWNVNENNADATTLLNSGAYTDLVRFAVFASEGGPVPSGATITSAQLSLYKTSYYDYVFQARRMLKDWVEGEATWSWPRIGATWAVAGAGGSGADYASVVDATASVGFSPGWLVFDVTAGVQAMSSGQANYGWRLLGVSGNSNEKQFASSEYATQSLRPSLVITYTTGSNAPPTVSITSPANGAVFVAGSTVTVNATAQDPGGSVSKVDFYRDGVLVGTDAAAPYSLPVAGLAAGTHVLTAVATDNLGATTTSAPVTITINTPPSVTITSPATGASFVMGTPVTVSATASDPGGMVTKVDFYRDGALVGTDTTSPYSVSVSGLTLGSHTLQAVATDNAGATTTAAVSINVTAGGGTVTLQDGLNGYTGTRDTYLSAWNMANYGSATTLMNSSAYTDLVRFAVFASEGGPVPNGATITSAQLSLYKTSAYDYTFQARRVLKDWVEGEATWNRPRIGAIWTVAGAGGSGTDYALVSDATASVGFAPGWLVFDVTSGVQAMSSGQANYGWRLLGVSGNANEKQFASSEYVAQSLRPKLTISYAP